MPDAATVPPARQDRPRPSAPPELDYNGRRHRRAMEDATLLDMARRIPAALGQTARLAWSVDRWMVITILTCQLLSGVGTGVMLAAVAKAMQYLFAASDATTALSAAWPPLMVAGIAQATGSAAWIMADWATRRLNPQVASAA